MSLEKVKDEVLSSAKSQAASMLSEGKKEAARILKDAQKKADELRDRLDAEAAKNIESLKRQEMASAELEAKKIVLEARKELVEEVFLAANARLDEMDDKKRESIIKRIMAKAKKDIDVAHIYANKKDSKIVKDLKPESAQISGGVICENKEKTIRVDYSYETILQSIRETKMQEISAILFG